MELREGLAYDDVLLVPQYSEISTRSSVDLSVKIGNLQFEHPIIPANMQTVTGERMASAVIARGGLAILHRFMPVEEQVLVAQHVYHTGGEEKMKHFAISVGVKDKDRANIPRLAENDVGIWCIDVAHGNSRLCVDMVQWIRENYPWSTIIAGNVATGDGARRLWEAGADVVKVGVGPGSLCTTRIETGTGVPQLTAIMDVQKVQQELLARDRATRYPDEPHPSYPFIADGGLKTAGDVVKALCFADMVMMGNTFAGCEEAPGETIKLDGRSYKKYVGSSTHKTNHVEGIAALVPCTENFHTVLTKLLEGVRSGMSYQGVDNLTDLKESPEFIRITAAGLKESHPHDVIIK